MTNLFPADIPLLSPSLDAEALKAYLDVLLPRCRALGCSELVLGSGKARSLRPEQDAEEGYTRLAELLNRKVLPTASEYGIRIILEPLNPLICNFILTLGEGAELCCRCDGQLALLADSLHLMHQENIAGEILRYSLGGYESADQRRLELRHVRYPLLDDGYRWLQRGEPLYGC